MISITTSWAGGKDLKLMRKRARSKQPRTWPCFGTPSSLIYQEKGLAVCILQLIPFSIAAVIHFFATSFSTEPPYVNHEPKEISLTFNPDFPTFLYFIKSLTLKLNLIQQKYSKIKSMWIFKKCTKPRFFVGLQKQFPNSQVLSFR